ncbi:MAG: rhomboid family intramembrane serine protease [Rhodospirillaceae bacterium]|nr:MAG: rhomboid family intramembrane serine protease [Rhodospirillaceae bacterium]
MKGDVFRSVFPHGPAIPWVSLGLIAICCAVFVLPPAVAGALIYDRTLVADGQPYRLLTFPIVHFNAFHLFYNVLALAVLAVLYEAGQGRRSSLRIAAVTAVAFLTSAVWVWEMPGVEHVGGMSGILHTMLCVAAIDLYRETKMKILLFIIAFYIARILFHWSWHMGDHEEPMTVAYSAHAVGLATAFAWSALDRFFSNSQSGRTGASVSPSHIDSALLMRGTQV